MFLFFESDKIYVEIHFSLDSRTLQNEWDIRHSMLVCRVLWNISCQSVLLSLCWFVCLSVCPSVTKSSQDWIISFFSDIVHGDSWPWYIVTDEARFLKKKKVFGAKGPESSLKLGFYCHLLKFDSLVSLAITCSDSL